MTIQEFHAHLVSSDVPLRMVSFEQSLNYEGKQAFSVWIHYFDNSCVLGFSLISFDDATEKASAEAIKRMNALIMRSFDLK